MWHFTRNFSIHIDRDWFLLDKFTKRLPLSLYHIRTLCACKSWAADLYLKKKDGEKHISIGPECCEWGFGWSCYTVKNQALIRAATLLKMRFWLELLHSQNWDFDLRCYTVKNEALIGAATLSKIRLWWELLHCQKWSFDWSCYTVKTETLIGAATLSKMRLWLELLHSQKWEFD